MGRHAVSDPHCKGCPGGYCACECLACTVAFWNRVERVTVDGRVIARLIAEAAEKR